MEKIGEIFRWHGQNNAFQPRVIAHFQRVNDGAAAMILASEEAVKRHGLTPRARILGIEVLFARGLLALPFVDEGRLVGRFRQALRRCYRQIRLLRAGFGAGS